MPIRMSRVRRRSPAVKCGSTTFRIFASRCRTGGPLSILFLKRAGPDVSLGVDERPVGGLGIHLIKSVVAHYTYAYYEQSNIIELYFALPE